MCNPAYLFLSAPLCGGLGQWSGCWWLHSIDCTPLLLHTVRTPIHPDTPIRYLLRLRAAPGSAGEHLRLLTPQLGDEILFLVAVVGGGSSSGEATVVQ